MLFRATTEKILLYGSQTWALTASEEKLFNGSYSRLLRKVKNLTCKNKVDNKTIYGSFRPITYYQGAPLAIGRPCLP